MLLLSLIAVNDIVMLCSTTALLRIKPPRILHLSGLITAAIHYLGFILQFQKVYCSHLVRYEWLLCVALRFMNCAVFWSFLVCMDLLCSLLTIQ